MEVKPLPGLEIGEPRKRCTMCQLWLPLHEFHRNRKRRDGLQTACRTCNTERNKRWYREHPEARGRRMDGYAEDRRLVWQAGLLEYLRSHPCVDCGEADPIVLEFDHLRDKIANVSAMVSSKRPWAIILEEIAKCDVVCANCHRRRTCARMNSFRHRMRPSADDANDGGTLPPAGV